MVGVNPPGHFVWKPGADRRAAAPLLGAVRATRACGDRSPRCGAPRRTSRSAGARSRSTAATSELASFFGLMDASSDGGADLGADDARRLARRRPTATRAACGSSRSPPRCCSRASRSGATAAAMAPDRRRGRGRHFAARRRDARSSAIPATASSGPAADWRTPGRPRPTRTPTRARGLRRPDAADQRRARRRDAGRERDPRPAAAPAQRPPGGAEGLRAHDRLLEHTRSAAGNHLINRYLDSGRGRRLALRAARRSTSPRRRRRRRSPRSSSAR